MNDMFTAAAHKENRQKNIVYDKKISKVRAVISMLLHGYNYLCVGLGLHSPVTNDMNGPGP